MTHWGVEGIECDIIDYSGVHDFFVVAIFLDTPYTCECRIRRLDTLTDEGWTDDLHIFMWDHDGHTRRINVGPSNTSLVRIPQEVGEFGEFRRASSSLPMYRQYAIFPPLYIQYIGRDEFNRIFNTDIVALPSTLFAVGITKEKNVYQYNDDYGGYNWIYEIELSIQHIVSVATDPQFGNIIGDRDMYFIICAHDGYMEHVYPSRRFLPFHVKEYEALNTIVYNVTDPHEYPVFHTGKYICAQSVQPSIDYVLAVPDRYYFCLNRYNEYRSIHRGIPFDTKRNMIVYAGSMDRGSHFNFTRRRDIEMSQRDYFKSDAVDKTHIYIADWIDKMEMIEYKYILDIDGNASTWDATAWKLNSGSVIFKTNTRWVQWFYDEFHEWEHYIPIADDFSDIQEKFAWCENHQEYCRLMVSRCQHLFHSVYRYENVVRRTQECIRTLLSQ